MGAIRVTKHKTLLKEAGVEPLKTHRKLHRLTYLFKIKKKLINTGLFPYRVIILKITI
jgi:hypothetical protein